MTDNDVAELTRDVKAKMEALDERFSDEAIDERIAEAIGALGDDEKFVRKIRFSGGDPRLDGSKYGRMGMGVADIEMLHNILTTGRDTPGVECSGPSEDLEKAFKAVSEGHYLDAVSAHAADIRKLEEMHKAGYLDVPAFKRAIRALDTAESGYGSQLIGAQYVTDLWAGARAESRVAALINSFPMTDPTAYLPVEADLPEMLFVAENTSATSSDYTTTKSGSNRVQVDAKKFIIHQMWSGELEEDSIIPLLPFLRRQAQMSIAHYSDSLVLNGDTTNAGTGNINLDDADPADTKHYLAFDGIRHVSLVDATGQGTDAATILTYDKLIDIRKTGIDRTYLFDWGHPSDPNDYVYVGDPEVCDAIGKLDEVITVDKFGPQATVLAGQQSRIGQNPLISSIAMSLTEADGFVSTTPGNNTLSQVLGFNRRAYALGLRRQVKVETERLPGRDQTRLVYSMRFGFGRFSPTGAASGIKSTGMLYNI